MKSSCLRDKTRVEPAIRLDVGYILLLPLWEVVHTRLPEASRRVLAFVHRDKAGT